MGMNIIYDDSWTFLGIRVFCFNMNDRQLPRMGMNIIFGGSWTLLGIRGYKIGWTKVIVFKKALPLLNISH
jgi:hypothetical protein